MKSPAMILAGMFFFFVPVCAQQYASAGRIKPSAVAHDVVKQQAIQQFMSQQIPQTNGLSKAELRKQKKIERKKRKREAMLNRKLQTLVLRMTGGYVYFSVL